MNTSLSTATAASTVSLLAVVQLQWIVTSFHVSMPADVATAAATLLTAGMHYLPPVHALPSPGAAKVVPAVPATPAMDVGSHTS